MNCRSSTARSVGHPKHDDTPARIGQADCVFDRNPHVVSRICPRFEIELLRFQVVRSFRVEAC